MIGATAQASSAWAVVRQISGSPRSDAEPDLPTGQIVSHCEYLPPKAMTATMGPLLLSTQYLSPPRVATPSSSIAEACCLPHPPRTWATL